MKTKPIPETVKIEVNIKVVKPSELTPAQKAAWRKWWQRLIGECKRELEADEREDKRGR